jgi:hypothetical protein
MRFLFTSASKPAALALARALAVEGHVVYAADVERICGTAPARYSRAYTHFYRLDTLSDLIKLWKTVENRVDMIIPFGHIPNHVKSRMEEMGAKVLGRTLFHDDLEFSDFVRDRVFTRPDTQPSVVKVPAAFTIHARAEIAEILAHYPKTTFSLQPGPYMDFDDGDTLVGFHSPSGSRSSIVFDVDEPQLVISFTALSDNVVESVKELCISETRSYRMVEIVEGGVEYSSHTFVSAGRICTFVVTADRVASHDVVAIPSSQSVFDIFYQFTGRFVDALNDVCTSSILGDLSEKDEKAFTGHLSLHFRVKDEIRGNGEFIRKVTATSCTNEPHDSIALLCSTDTARRQLAHAYAQINNKVCRMSFPMVLPTTSTAWGLYSVPAAAKSLARIATFSPLNRSWSVTFDDHFLRQGALLPRGDVGPSRPGASIVFVGRAIG